MDSAAYVRVDFALYVYAAICSINSRTFPRCFGLDVVVSLR